MHLTESSQCCSIQKPSFGCCTSSFLPWDPPARPFPAPRSATAGAAAARCGGPWDPSAACWGVPLPLPGGQREVGIPYKDKHEYIIHIHELHAIEHIFGLLSLNFNTSNSQTAVFFPKPGIILLALTDTNANAGSGWVIFPTRQR